jgi:alpha-D-xyloside xylohydrolase
MEQLFPGVWKISLGSGEAVTPVKLRHRPPASTALKALAPVRLPFDAGTISGRATRRGFQIHIPLGSQEQLYGLGLQLQSFQQRGRKKTLRVNSDPRVDLGDSHAPVPFYVSTAGYGVLIDTARYATFYLGSANPRGAAAVKAGPASAAASSEELYSTRQSGVPNEAIVEVPCADGVDVYVFAGEDMSDAVSRYNLFSGGGCLPPRWGLGVWYRCAGSFDQKQAQHLAIQLREDQMPCDVYGLEPGWQSHAYSCTWEWSEKFPDPPGLVAALASRHFRMNLWTHAFVHHENPNYEALLPTSGDYLVWQGLVPDFTVGKVRRIVAEHHERRHVELGISGYKLDECDNSDFISGHPWSYPEMSAFPSGLDGEQMHCLMGINYQETIESIFRRRDQRTCGQVRSSHALAANYPFVLYSDLYDHREYIRGLVNSGFSGLLWSPEVRDAMSKEDLIRRLQTVVLSPQAVINAWYIANPPWKQWRLKENNDGVFLEDFQQLQAACREILNLRMRLVPYLYSAFYRYHLHGLPPFRALAMDWPDDEGARAVDDQWMIGDDLMAAPAVAPQLEREVHFPPGKWFDFWTGRQIEGGRKIMIRVPLETVPIFVRGDALIPLARITQHTDDPASMSLTVQIYGRPGKDFTLYEDDGATYGFTRGEYNRLVLTWDADSGAGQANRIGSGEYPAYQIVQWAPVGERR